MSLFSCTVCGRATQVNQPPPLSLRSFSCQWKLSLSAQQQVPVSKFCQALKGLRAPLWAVWPIPRSGGKCQGGPERSVVPQSGREHRECRVPVGRTWGLA